MLLFVIWHFVLLIYIRWVIVLGAPAPLWNLRTVQLSTLSRPSWPSGHSGDSWPIRFSKHKTTTSTTLSHCWRRGMHRHVPERRKHVPKVVRFKPLYVAKMPNSRRVCRIHAATSTMRQRRGCGRSVFREP